MQKPPFTMEYNLFVVVVGGGALFLDCQNFAGLMGNWYVVLQC